MKRIALLVCLLVATVAAQAQFEKGKWILDASLSGLNLTRNTDTDKTNFGLEAKGGAFLADNFALLLDIGGQWPGGGTNVTKVGVGGRYYISSIGLFAGADVNFKHIKEKYLEEGEDGKYNRVGFGVEVGYAFFLSRTVTLEPSVFWDIDKDRSEFGLKLGFGFYF